MKRKRKTRRHARDVAAASGALLFSLGPEIEKLDDRERFRRLCGVIEGAIYAFHYVPEEEFKPPIPSRN